MLHLIAFAAAQPPGTPATAEWPEVIHFAGTLPEEDDHASLIWSQHFAGEHALPLGPVSSDELDDLGLSKGMTVWVLPLEGPAVKRSLLGVRHIELIDCSESYQGIVLDVEALGEDRALAFSLEEPPDSWSERAYTRPSAAADKAMASRLSPRKGVQTASVLAGKGAFVRASWADGKTADGLANYTVVDTYRHPDGRLETVRAIELGSANGVPVPVAYRDIDGDGQGEVVLSDGCTDQVPGNFVDPRAGSFALCCGC